MSEKLYARVYYSEVLQGVMGSDQFNGEITKDINIYAIDKGKLTLIEYLEDQDFEAYSLELVRDKLEEMGYDLMNVEIEAI